jgi:hypothetical protein
MNMHLITFKKTYKIIKVHIILFLILFLLLDFNVFVSAENEKPIKFYLYNSVDIEKEWPLFPTPTNYSLYGKLNTTLPDELKENYTFCPTDIENFTYMHGSIGHWFSEPIYYSINTTLNITVNIWVESQTNITNVSFVGNILVPLYNNSLGYGYYSRYGTGIYGQNLSTQTTRFSFGHDFSYNKNLRNEGRIKFELAWNYTPSENSGLDNVTLISFSEDMRSSVQLYLDSVNLKIANYSIDKSENVIEINTKISDALGLTDIKEYSLSIIGPIENVTPYERIIYIKEYSINSNWTWDYGSVKAPSGNYTIILTVIDNSNNTWEDTITIFLESNKIIENKNNYIIYWITSLLIIISTLIIYILSKLERERRYYK